MKKVLILIVLFCVVALFAVTASRYGTVTGTCTTSYVDADFNSDGDQFLRCGAWSKGIVIIHNTDDDDEIKFKIRCYPDKTSTDYYEVLGETALDEGIANAYIFQITMPWYKIIVPIKSDSSSTYKITWIQQKE